MPTHDDLLIRVQSEWNGWRHAEVHLRDLKNVHWFQPGPAPHPLVHGYIACTNVVAGGIPHDCDRTVAPHRLLVCVLKKHSLPTVFEELVRRADDASRAARFPAGSRSRVPGLGEHGDSDGFPASAHGVALTLAERVRRTVHRIRAT